MRTLSSTFLYPTLNSPPYLISTLSLPSCYSIHDYTRQYDIGAVSGTRTGRGVEDNFEESAEGGQIILSVETQHAVLHKQPSVPLTGKIDFHYDCLILFFPTLLSLMFTSPTVLR